MIPGINEDDRILFKLSEPLWYAHHGQPGRVLCFADNLAVSGDDIRPSVQFFDFVSHFRSLLGRFSAVLQEVALTHSRIVER